MHVVYNRHLMKSRPGNVIHVSDVTSVKSAARHEDLASGLQIIKISGGEEGVR